MVSILFSTLLSICYKCSLHISLSYDDLSLVLIALMNVVIHQREDSFFCRKTLTKPTSSKHSRDKKKKVNHQKLVFASEFDVLVIQHDFPASI